MKLMHAAVFAATGFVAVSAVLMSGSASAEQASLPATLICEPMSSAYDVNDAGVVAGYVGSWPTVRAATCHDGTVTYLALPEDATGSIAVAINNAGQAAGQINLSNGQEAVIWDSSGAITRLGFLPGGPSFSSAQDINDNGWVVGVTSNGSGYRGFLWDGSGPIEALPIPSGMTSAFAQAINNNGAIAGSASAGYPLPPPYPPGIAVVWQDGAVTALPPLANGATASAADINDAGQVVGNSATTAPPWLVRDAVLWDGGTAVDLGSLGGSFGLASAINANGGVAGYMTDPETNQYHGFVWEDGQLTLLDPLSGDASSVGLGMNNNGEIVGISSQSASGAGRAVRWTLAGDTSPPDLSIGVSPNVLWPPNHKYVTVHATATATDDSGVDPTIELVTVVSNEPDNAPGDVDGNTVDDIVTGASDPYTVQLRAERDERGTGRTYTVTYRATDGSGNSTAQSATVTVPLTW